MCSWCATSTTPRSFRRRATTPPTSGSLTPRPRERRATVLPGFGYPTDCSTANIYPFAKNSQISHLSVVDWYIGNNNRAADGGRSLYRKRLDSGGVIVTEEVVAGVTNMEIKYRVDGTDSFVDASIGDRGQLAEGQRSPHQAHDRQRRSARVDRMRPQILEGCSALHVDGHDEESSPMIRSPFAARSINAAPRSAASALAVSLILLVIAVILGLAASRGTLLQERMSANMYDRSLAFQRAESALRAAEPQSAAAGRSQI